MALPLLFSTPPLPPPLDSGASADPALPAAPPPPGSMCEGCGRTDKVWGCDGKGRIMGGIASVPLLEWWPIKAYRPCPAFIEAGGKYKRQGQRLEEFAYGRRINKKDDA